MAEPANYLPTVSVLIPTLNGGHLFGQVLDALKTQTISPVEIIVADSESTDTTLDYCRAPGIQVVAVAREAFDHGGTRTMLAKMARGEVVVFLPQDALPVTADALQKLIAPLAETDIACSYGRQLAAENASLFAEHLRLFNYPAQSEVHRYEDRHCLGLKTVFMSNSFSAYKKSLLAENDYFKNGLIFGEDTFTVGKILKRGFGVAYCAEAMVVHSHNYTVIEEFSRSYDIGVLHSSEKWLLEDFGMAEGVGKKYVKSLLAEIVKKKRFHLFAEFLIRTGAKYLGYKLGRGYRNQPCWLRVHCSMNRSWWTNNSAT